MTWALVASTAIAGGPVTTPAINCLTADLIVAEVSSNTLGAFTDSTGLNTWIQIGNFISGAADTSLFYCLRPNVSATQTFSYSGTFCCINVTAWSGSMGGSVDKTANAIGTGVTTLAAGSITPSFNNSLIIAGIGMDAGNTLTIGTGTIQQNTPFSFGNNEGGAIASFVQATAAPINPSWSWTGAANAAAIVASFAPVLPIVIDYRDGFTITGAGATTGPFSLLGGEYGITCKAAFAGGSVALQLLGPDGSTYITVQNFTANGAVAIYLPAGLYQVGVVTATTVNLSCVPVSRHR